MHDPDDKNIKPIKCVACGADESNIETIPEHEKYNHAAIMFYKENILDWKNDRLKITGNDK